MPFLPDIFLASLEGLPGFERQAFLQAHEELPAPVSIRLNPFKPVAGIFPEAVAVPWAAQGRYLAERPSFTFDPFFHAGAYYVQEASSMFLEQALQQHAPLSRPLKVLDLCAAPGGKSTHLLSLLSSGSLLVSNEVIRPRCLVLEDNLVKWGCTNSIVTQADPAAWGELGSFFDIIVADAPCSGSGLFRKEADAITHWSPQAVNLCSQRQQRILADVLPALAPGGLLVYSTCSYSAEENEQIADWLVHDFGLESLPIVFPAGWGIVGTGGGDSAAGYRFYPGRVRGEGFFMACFRKTDGAESITPRVRKKPVPLTKQDSAVLAEWINGGDEHIFLQEEEGIRAFPAAWLNELLWLREKLRVQGFGTELGRVMKHKLAPAHGLAMSAELRHKFPALELKKEDALRFLGRHEINPATELRGWALACYRSLPLGWLNILPGRMNNNYPKALRILSTKYEG